MWLATCGWAMPMTGKGLWRDGEGDRARRSGRRPDRELILDGGGAGMLEGQVLVCEGLSHEMRGNCQAPNLAAVQQ